MGSAGRKSPAGSRGEALVGVWGQSIQKQNLNFRFMKRSKAVFRIYTVHIRALIFLVCMTHLKRK